MSVAVGAGPVEPKNDRVETPFQRFVSEFAESKIALLGFAVFSVIIVVALLAPWISPQNPYDLAVLDIMEPARPEVAEGQIAPDDPTVATYRRRLSSVVLS